MSRLQILVVSAAFTLLTSTARADWGPWEPCAPGLSISYSEVIKGTWTWKFRNEVPSTVMEMKFEYVSDGRIETDILLHKLKQGEVFGGWAAYTAISAAKPRVVIRHIKRDID